MRFHGKLKKPVIAKRASVTSGSERLSISVVERNASIGKDRSVGNGEQGQWDRRTMDRRGSRGTRSPSPAHSDKSFARSFASVNTTLSFTDRDGESKEGRYGRHSKAPGMANSMSGSSVYSFQSARSVSTVTSVSAYSTSSGSNSVSSDLTATEHISLGASSLPSLPSAPSEGLTATPSGTILTSFLTEGSVRTGSFGSQTSVDIDSVEETPSVALRLSSPANLPPVAPLRLSKSPRHIPTGLSPSSPVHSISSTASSPVIPPVLSAGLSSSSLPSSLSPGPPRALSPGSPATSTGLSGSVSPGLSISLSPGLPGSHSPSPRSPVFSTRSQVYISSGTSSSSLPLPNPYGPSSSSPYVTIGGYTGLSPPPTAPPTGPLPPAPQSDQVHGKPANEDLEIEEDLDEIEEGNTTRLSTLDAFRRRLREEDDDEDDDHPSVHSQDDEHGGWLGSKSQVPYDHNELVERRTEDGLAQTAVHSEDGNSDGEVGIGLSLMSALDDGSDDDIPWTSIRHAVDAAKKELGAPSLQDRSPNGHSQSPVPSPTSGNGAVINGHDSCPGSQDGEDNDGEEEDVEGGYWDDIYDDYRYSRYSLASKRFSIASRRMSVVSKASAGSKGSGTSKSSRAPPVPVPIFPSDRPSLSVERPSLSTEAPNFERPSFGSDRPSEDSEQDFRPSVESTSPAGSSISQSPEQTFSPSFDLSLSDDTRSSSYSTQTLDRLSSQFPAVPTSVPVRVESRLRIVNDGHVEHEDDVHRKKEMEVMHESTMNDSSDGEDDEVDAKQVFQGNKGHRNGVLSPNLSVSHPHPTIRSPSADTEDRWEQEYSLESQRRMHESRKSDDDTDLLTGGLKSPFETEELVDERTSRGQTGDTHGFSAIIATSSSTSSGSKAIVSNNANVVRDNKDDSFSSSSMETSQTSTAPPSKSSTPKPLHPVEQLPQTRHPFSRTSIFLPHPNAPRPTGHQGLGPMYARPTQLHIDPPGTDSDTISWPPNSSPFAASVLHRLRNSLAHAPGPGAPARRPPMTIFARCQPDLSMSTGPVSIVFSLEPLPPLPPSPNGFPSQIQTPTSAMFPMRSATLPPALRKSPFSTGASSPSGRTFATTEVALSGGMKEQITSGSNVPSLRVPKRSATTSIAPPDPARELEQTAVTEKETVGSAAPAIPRPGFMLQVGAVRPRSRSFSAFGAKIAETTGQETR